MIIGLCGNKGHGKDTLADILVNKYNFKKLAFADILKNSLKELFDWDDKSFSHEFKENKDNYWGVSPREMCQQLGTEFLRLHCKDLISSKFVLPTKEEYTGSFHIKRINLQVIKLLKDNCNIVFSDVRFQDEVNYIKKLNGYIIKIFRPNINQNLYNNHISESEIDNLINIDRELVNIDLECVDKELDSILKSI